MSFSLLLQIFVDLVLVAGCAGLWIRLNRPQKDDPRLSKGLQLLQSKIAVLEDLSDRTELQVNQLTTLLEQKCRELQLQVQHSEKQLLKIDQSMQKSLDVAKIFQDRIPHTEILERQNTIKYVKAARLAHQGLSAEQIAAQVDLSTGEIEFICKVNKDKLMFCEDSLPEWAQASTEAPMKTGFSEDGNDVDGFQESRIDHDMGRTFATDAPSATSSVSAAVPVAEQDALKKLGDAFRQACETAGHVEEVTQGFVEGNRPPETSSGPVVRPVKFPRIESNKY